MQKKWMRWTALPLLLLAALLTAVFPAMAADDEPEFGGSVGVRLLDDGTCGSIRWEFYADGDLHLSGSGAVEDNCTAWAAYNSKITKVYVYSGVTGIGNNVFADCTGITEVRYGGTYPGWCKVKVGENNAPLTAITVTFPRCSGWVSENGTWYCYDANHRPVMNDWMKDSVGWVYLGADGAMVKNAWLTDSHGVCYVGADGYCVTNCWMQHENGWVYLGDSGSVVKNEWLRHNGKWRYVGADGFSVTSEWREDSQGWIWLDEEGYMTYDRWITVGDDTYYCDEDGYRVTGTVEIQGVTYQFDENGVLLKCRVEFVDWDGTVLSSVTCLYGDTVTPPADPVRAEDDQYIYTFAGWTPELTTVTGDAIYTATYTAEKRENPEENAIVEQPRSVNVETGENAQFTVVATGEILSYKWEYRKIWKWFDTTMEGYNTDTLTVPANGTRNGYDYRCVITFADGTQLTTEPAELTVNTYITDVVGPNDQTVVLGYKGQFTASAQGEGIKYQWQYKRPGSALWIDTAMEGATRPTVMIETTAARDGYQYRCQITDVTGNVVTYTEPATMRVLSFKAHPVETFAAAGTTATFTVGTSVDSGFTYQWQYSKDGEDWTNSTMNGYNTATLTVDATTARNGYAYRCVLTGSKNSQIASKTAVLHVGEPVEITAQPQSVSATAADTVTFTVEASNVYAYQWQYRNATATQWRNTSAEGNQTATLTIAAKGKNNYKYRCVLYGLDGTETYTEVAVLTVG